MHATQSLIEAAVLLAAELQREAVTLQTPSERRQQAELDRMLRNTAEKATLVELTDQSFRSHAAARTADQFTHILDVQGIPRFFSPLDQALLLGFQTFGSWLPSVTVPLVTSHLRHETANVVLPAEPDLLHAHLTARRQQGLRMNLNFLGEALLGEAEAAQRLSQYAAALRSPEIEVLSVKISTIDSQIMPIARAHTLARLCDRLETLYREAGSATFTEVDGREVPKLLYLDMEEYRDLSLTAEAFMQTLERPGLSHVHAGIALQAYVPDSLTWLKRIADWATNRVTSGGAPVTVRIVKGANMEMERIDAALHGWPQAPFRTKRETDANYKRMLEFALAPEQLRSLRVGVASHNLFDVAYGLVLAAERGAGDRVQFEMLEGMANHQRRALLAHTQRLLLYAPACRKDDFLNAIGYLIRRLDENTGPENFLGHAFRLEVGSDDWKRLEQGFRDSFTIDIPHAPQRTQDRRTECFREPRVEQPWQEFANEPDTDWCLAHNAAWAAALVARDAHADANRVVPVVVAGREAGGSEHRTCKNPSRPGSVLGTSAVASDREVDEAVACGVADPDGWRTQSVDARSEVLGRVAMHLRKARGDLLRVAMLEGGKLLTEADPEVSEAVDFVEFYRAAARTFFELPGVRVRGCGTVVVVPPWNFPIAIPCGGIAAALAAGNTVILKPASSAVLTAWEVCQCFWRAGVSQRTLQFLPCTGAGPGARLVAHPHVSAVILTGGTATALAMLAATPTLRLSAETGGKNATIVSAMSDRELAIKHVVHAAFSHAGQKCSATSLLLLEAEVYDDPGFERMLCDAVASLHVGPADQLHTRVAPLIHPPTGVLATGLSSLEPGERWAVKPQQRGDNPHLWSPGVKYGVQPGSQTHQTEFFGPLLAVMRYERLADAIAYVNATGYGLTSAIHSLDDREIAQWKQGIRAGNLYVNRGTTGAIVLRQPFGGWGKSAVGPGLKTGGPNYVAAFLDFEDAERPDDALLQAAIASYDAAWREEFAHEHDHVLLLGQDNLRRYVPFATICVRITPADRWYDIAARVVAARVTGARVLASFEPGCPAEWLQHLDAWTQSWATTLELAEQPDEAIAALVPQPDVRIRYAARDRVPSSIRNQAAACGTWIADVPVVAAGRVELLWYLREQSVSFDYHRYGNLGRRSNDVRRPLVEPSGSGDRE